MYKIFVFIFFLFVEAMSPLRAESGLLSSLSALGFENISIGNTDNSDWITFEDRVNRNRSVGIEEAIRVIIDSPDIQKETDIILLSDRLPVLKCHLSESLIADYRKGIISFQDVLKGVIIVYNTDDYRQGQKRGRVVNSSSGTIDLVIYPQVGLANYRLDKLYVVDISLAPALEMQLWPGAKFTGQVVFPVYNNLKGEVDYIRPGILALSQSFRLRDNVFGCLSAGNFTEDRMGVDAEIGFRSNKGYWGIGAKAGLTGSSTFYGGKWEVSDWKRVSFAFKTYFYEPTYNLQFDLSIGQYIYGDRGGRLDCTRHFGEVLVGVFAMYSGRVANGGFHFSIPLPGRKRKRSKNFPIRVMLPEYFDWEYQAQSGPDYQNRRLGRSYKTDNNRSEAYRFNPLFIKSDLRKN
nr:YjbH domain-containing protein [Parabacteroides goldsteinii]